MLPDKNARILIYCNNNFTPQRPVAERTRTGTCPRGGAKGKAAKIAFRGRGQAVSLNISTYTTLYSYGYKNVYELGPIARPGHDQARARFEQEVTI